MSQLPRGDHEPIPPGTLDMLILTTVARDGELHGFEIAEAIQRGSDDVLRVESVDAMKYFHDDTTRRALVQALGDGESLVRRMPGRIAGQTVDRRGKRCFVLTLQTREQHIRREKATSNVCTNQGLFALRATIYLALLGPHGLRETANLCLQKSRYAIDQLCNASATGSASAFSAASTSATSGTGRFQLAFSAPTFKEFVIRDKQDRVEEFLANALKAGFLAGVPLGQWYPELGDCLLLAVTEKRTKREIDDLIQCLH